MCPILNNDSSPHLWILILLWEEEDSPSVLTDRVHTYGVLQDAPVKGDCNPGSLAAGREPNIISLVGLEMLIVNPNRQSFFPQRLSQLFTSQISIAKEDIDFRLLGRSELLLQFEVPSTRSPQLCFRPLLRY